MKKDKNYYYFEDDLIKYPEAWCYIVYSKRGPGKTYSSLRYSKDNNITIIYMKRTNDDVNLICSDNDGFNASPYAPLNRDFDYNIHLKQIKKGVGAAYVGADGDPIAYILSLNAIKSFKGIDFSSCDWVIFDEFIPQQGEIIKRAEGDMLLDLYMTVARDRQKRGKKPLKLILFANAEEISTPITNTLEVVDDIALLNSTGQSHMFLEKRGILLHRITEDEVPLKASEETGIYKAMKHTQWAKKTFEGEFSNNDFSNVVDISLKRFRIYMHLRYKTFDYYIYSREDGMFYMTNSKQQCDLFFDLNLENDQKKFWLDYGIDLRVRCIEGRMKFKKYSMYDLIVNYKSFFKI